MTLTSSFTQKFELLGELNGPFQSFSKTDAFYDSYFFLSPVTISSYLRELTVRHAIHKLNNHISFP